MNPLQLKYDQGATWLGETCEFCIFQDGHYCRKNPPQLIDRRDLYSTYPVVVKRIPDGFYYESACSFLKKSSQGVAGSLHHREEKETI